MLVSKSQIRKYIISLLKESNSLPVSVYYNSDKHTLEVYDPLFCNDFLSELMAGIEGGATGFGQRFENLIVKIGSHLGIGAPKDLNTAEGGNFEFADVGIENENQLDDQIIQAILYSCKMSSKAHEETLSAKISTLAKGVKTFYSQTPQGYTVDPNKYVVPGLITGYPNSTIAELYNYMGVGLTINLYKPTKLTPIIKYVPAKGSAPEDFDVQQAITSDNLSYEIRPGQRMPIAKKFPDTSITYKDGEINKISDIPVTDDAGKSTQFTSSYFSQTKPKKVETRKGFQRQVFQGPIVYTVNDMVSKVVQDYFVNTIYKLDRFTNSAGSINPTGKDAIREYFIDGLAIENPKKNDFGKYFLSGRINVVRGDEYIFNNYIDNDSPLILKSKNKQIEKKDLLEEKILNSIFGREVMNTSPFGVKTRRPSEKRENLIPKDKQIEIARILGIMDGLKSQFNQFNNQFGTSLQQIPIKNVIILPYSSREEYLTENPEGSFDEGFDELRKKITQFFDASLAKSSFKNIFLTSDELRLVDDEKADSYQPQFDKDNPSGVPTPVSVPKADAQPVFDKKREELQVIVNREAPDRLLGLSNYGFTEAEITKLRNELSKYTQTLAIKLIYGDIKAEEIGKAINAAFPDDLVATQIATFFLTNQESLISKLNLTRESIEYLNKKSIEYAIVKSIMHMIEDLIENMARQNLKVIEIQNKLTETFDNFLTPFGGENISVKNLESQKLGEALVYQKILKEILNYSK